MIRFGSSLVGPANVASKGGPNMRTLRSGSSAGMKSKVTVSSNPTKRSKATGSTEGLNAGRSTYIKPNDSGYGAVRDVRPKGPPPLNPSHNINPATALGLDRGPTVSDMTTSKVNPFRADTQLASMIR